MDLHLVGAAGCPYTERVMVALGEKGAAFTLSVVDPAAPPDWVAALSPRGEVPLLVAAGTPLVEAQPMCEFVDEALPGPALLPEDPFERARDRAWFHFADTALLHPLYGMLLGTRPDDVGVACDAVESALAAVQDEMAGHDWLSGDGSRFGLADLAMVPFFSRLALLEALGTYEFPADRLPGVDRYRARLLARPAVREAWLDGGADALRAMMRRVDALLLPGS